jgi:hypothetical protein
MSLLIAILIVIGYIFILILERSPTIKVVPEIVESLDFLFGAIIITQFGHGLDFREAPFGFEEGRPEFVEVSFLLARWRDVGEIVDRVPLAPLDGVEKDFVGLLDAFEEIVVFGFSRCGLFVGVVAQDLLAVGTLDLFGSCAVAVFAEAEDGVVILALEGCQRR